MSTSKIPTLARLQKQRLLILSLKKWIPKLRYLLFIIGICWFFVFPLEKYNKHTYISENALLPGQVNTYYSWSNVFEAADYRDQIESVSNASKIEKVSFIENKLRMAGLKTATQNFTVKVSGKTISGINVFAVLNAPRADGTEALVLSAPWKSRDDLTTNVNGIAAILSIGKFFKSKFCFEIYGYTYWSKDIIFLITDEGEAGVQAWLESYHDYQRSNIIASPLLLRSGVIQAAINLDFPGTSDYRAIELFFEGVNGQLPNLDLINIIILCTARVSYSIPIKLNGSGHYYNFNDAGDYLSSLYNLLMTMKYQALSHPTGSHGLFFRYKIDAITLYGKSDAPVSSSYGFMEIGSDIPITTNENDKINQQLNQAQSSESVELKPKVLSLPYNKRPREILYPMIGLVISHIAGLKQPLKPASDWIILKSFTLAFSGMLISCLSVLNFSLAVFISLLVLIPFSLFQPNQKNQPQKNITIYLQSLILFMISPPGILIISRTNIEDFLNWALLEYELLGNKISSAHVYLRLRSEQKWDNIPLDLLNDLGQLVKANSIQGSKEKSITIVYTPWSNLLKTPGMATGVVKKFQAGNKENVILKRLEKTKIERHPDLEAEKVDMEKEVRRIAREKANIIKQEQLRLERERKEQKAKNSYDTIFVETNMRSNTDAIDMEEDFM
ncbi:6071_t:CDS:10 [Entrophospora sp. SA101]|nr:6071_t:CDS:10 [Entrophospora sp. SA101]